MVMALEALIHDVLRGHPGYSTAPAALAVGMPLSPDDSAGAATAVPRPRPVTRYLALRRCRSGAF